MRRSCETAGCPLLTNGQCYAWNGTPRLAYTSIERRHQQGIAYDLPSALENSLRSARYVRIAALGDPCVLSREEIEATYAAVKREGFRGVLGYTHGWRDAGAHLRGMLMASCDSLPQADEAVDRGWRATAILPWDTTPSGIVTPAGRSVVVCPAQTKRGVNCNMCGLCDASRNGPEVIGFLDHGPKARGEQRRDHRQ